MKYTSDIYNTYLKAQNLDNMKSFKFSKEEKNLIHNSEFIFRSYKIKYICFIVKFVSALILTSLSLILILFKLGKPFTFNFKNTIFIMLPLFLLSLLLVKILFNDFSDSLYKKWWRCPSCGEELPKKYLMFHKTIMKMDIKPVDLCPNCKTALPNSLAEAKRIAEEKAMNKELSKEESKKQYHWGINRIIFACIINPYDNNGELSDDAMGYVERDSIPCIQSLFHFLIMEKADYLDNYKSLGYKDRTLPVFLEKPDHTDSKYENKKLLQFQFSNETFFLYMDVPHAEKIQQLITEYHDEDIIITEI